MVYGGGLQKEFDRMDRDAKAQSSYNSFENSYLYETMQPPEIGDWEWKLMFDRLSTRESRKLAMQDAKEMALELGVETIVKEVYPGCFKIEPIDLYKTKDSSRAITKYQEKRLHFIKQLVVHEKYPDLPGIARKKDLFGKSEIFNHYFHELRETHAKWKEEYESLTDSQKRDFDD